jgi:cytochrome P450
VALDRDGDLKRWSDAYVSHAGRRPTKEQSTAQAHAHHKMQTFFMEQLVDRQSSEQDDLLSHLVSLSPERNPDAPSADQLTITQSSDTSSSSWWRVMRRRPSSWGPGGAARAPSGGDAAGPVRSVAAREPARRGAAAELAGIGALRALFAAANRDPAVFADPDRFVSGRANAGDHVAFGSGIHRCLGAALAKATAQACLEQILERYAAIELLATSADDDHGKIMMRGRRRIPLVFTGRAAAPPPAGLGGGHAN